jgi:hypothetical protein
MFLCGSSVSYSSIPADYEWKSHSLTISAIAPPAFITIEDSSGMKSGFIPLSQCAQNGTCSVFYDQIPYSEVSIVNLVNDETGHVGELESNTTWQIRLVDPVKQKLQVKIYGVENGLSDINFNLIYDKNTGKKDMHISTPVVSGSGSNRLIEVTLDADMDTLKALRVVSPADVLLDLRSMCQLNLISPPGVCNSLTAKVNHIRSAIDRKDEKVARNGINSLLNELNAESGKHVKEPAATILREEAEVLLNSLALTQTVQPQPLRKSSKHWWWPF